MTALELIPVAFSSQELRIGLHWLRANVGAANAEAADDRDAAAASRCASRADG